MIEKISAAQTLGIMETPSHLMCAKLSLIDGNPHIESLDSFEESVKPLYITDEWLVTTGISASKILTRPTEIQLTKLKDVEAVVKFQAEPLLPYPIDEAVVEYVPIESSKTHTQVTLISLEKEKLEEHIKRFEKIDIEPEVVTCTPAALALFGYYFGVTPRSDWPQFVIYAGEEGTTCVLAKKGKLLGSHSFMIGKKDLENKQVSENLRLEIGKSIYALAKQAKVDNVTEILLCGPTALVKDFPLSLSKTLKTSVTLPPKRHNATKEELLKYALPIGLALSSLETEDYQVNFRQEDYSYPYPWKRYKKTLGIYFSLCALLSLSLYLFGNSWVANHESKIKQSYAKLLSTINKPYTQFEKEYLVKTKKIPEGQEVEVSKLIELNQKEIESRLNYLSQDIRATPEVFPLLPQAPKASDILAWLSAHPNIYNPSQKEPLIDIKSFTYTLIKRPDNKKKQEKYLYKVDLEFTTSTPKNAREFHDALISSNEMIDPKSEVKWSQTRDQYKTSFFLKNRQGSAK